MHLWLLFSLLFILKIHYLLQSTGPSSVVPGWCYSVEDMGRSTECNNMLQNNTEFSLTITLCFFEMHFNVIRPFAPCSSKWGIFFRFSNHILTYFRSHSCVLYVPPILPSLIPMKNRRSKALLYEISFILMLLLSFKPKYYPQLPLLKHHPQPFNFTPK